MKAYQLKSILKQFVVIPAVTWAFLGSAEAGFPVDTNSREQSRTLYNAVYPAADNVPSGWNGSVANGVEGGTTQAYKNAVFLRINYFRAMAGLSSDVTNNPAWSAMDQSAALMMSANSALDHTPPTSWRFYSAAGAEAAGKSNLSLSTCGPDAITSYMEDAGAPNQPVGHRRWILFPQTQQMGTGDIPANGTSYAANALWTLDLNHYADPRPAVRDDFVAWPPRGYVPYQLIYPRWSFSYPNADFKTAQVSVTRGGIAIPASIAEYVEGYGENTMVFVPNNIDADAWTGPVKPAGDIYYSVSISNVIVDGVARSFSYAVIAFDPATPGADTPNFTIAGSATPKAGALNTYSVPPQTLATGYQWKYSSKGPYTAVVGAENSAGVLASVPGGYNFRDSKVKAVGKFSYHLTHVNFTESSFVLRDPVFCNNATKLNFSSRLAYSTNFETATVEVSTDGGNQWNPIWSQAGKNSPGELGFVKRSISLRAYNGREVKVRFRYAIGQGAAYTQTDAGVGWYVDDVSFLKGERLLATKTTAVSSAPQFSLKPTLGVTYIIQARSQVYGAYFRDWSVAKTVKGK